MIYYRAGYKYQLAADYAVLTPFHLVSPVETEWLRLSEAGWLLIRQGYAWDGPSGPTLDTASAMRGSLIHDALYQLIRLGNLGVACRAAADQIYEDCLIADAEAVIQRTYPRLMQAPMIALAKARAWSHFKALRAFGGTAAEPSAEKLMLTAPL